MNDDQKFIYKKLREEVMDLVKRQDTYLLAAYTITITIWTVAVERNNPWIALLPLFILFVISLRICDFRDSSAFLSAYISIWLEKKPGIGWSYTREKYFEIIKNKERTKRNIWIRLLDKTGKYLSRMSLCVLSIVSIALFWKMRESHFDSCQNIFKNMLIVSIQLIVLIIQIYKWCKYVDTTEVKKEYMDNWKTVCNIIIQEEKEEH